MWNLQFFFHYFAKWKIRDFESAVSQNSHHRENFSHTLLSIILIGFESQQDWKKLGISFILSSGQGNNYGTFSIVSIGFLFSFVFVCFWNNRICKKMLATRWFSSVFSLEGRYATVSWRDLQWMWSASQYKFPQYSARQPYYKCVVVWRQLRIGILFSKAFRKPEPNFSISPVQ